jgi:uncharacterized protein (TIGR00255 family)
MSEQRGGPVSMTGYGKASLPIGEADIVLEVEARAVNHRFFELTARLPREFQFLESKLRAVAATRVQRGKLELSVVRRRRTPDSTHAPDIAQALSPLLTSYASLCHHFGIVEDRRGELLIQLLLRKDLDTPSGQQQGISDQEMEGLLQAVGMALDELLLMRRAEGEALARDLRDRLDELGQLREKMLRLSEEMTAGIYDRLRARIEKIAPDLVVDPARLAAEVVIHADRSCVSEEVVRLESHLEQFHAGLQEPGNGRRLEFILQECGREVNTVGSKAQSSPLQTVVVEAKVLLEKMREQVLNLA